MNSEAYILSEAQRCSEAKKEVRSIKQIFRAKIEQDI
jgi:hypothetical protein